MKKNELIGTYGRIGERLHRGTLKKLLDRKLNVPVDFSEMVAIAQSIQNLLASHVVAPLSGNPILCTLSDLSAGGNATVRIAIPGPSLG